MISRSDVNDATSSSSKKPSFFSIWGSRGARHSLWASARLTPALRATSGAVSSGSLIPKASVIRTCARYPSRVERRSVSRSRVLHVQDQLCRGILGIAEQHDRLRVEEQLVLHAGEPRPETALQEDHGLGFV